MSNDLTGACGNIANSHEFLKGVARGDPEKRRYEPSVISSPSCDDPCFLDVSLAQFVGPLIMGTCSMVLRALFSPRCVLNFCFGGFQVSANMANLHARAWTHIGVQGL